MIGVIIILLFLGFDLAVVVAALLWLSVRRAQADPSDVRYRRRPVRYR